MNELFGQPVPRISRPGTLLTFKEPSCLLAYFVTIPPLTSTSQLYCGPRFCKNGYHQVHSLFTGAFSWAIMGDRFPLGKEQKTRTFSHILNTNTCFQPSLGPLKTVWFSSYQAPILWYKIPLGLPLVSYPFSLFQVAPHKWRKTTLNYCQTHSVLSEMLSKHINVNPPAFNHF